MFWYDTLYCQVLCNVSGHHMAIVFFLCIVICFVIAMSKLSGLTLQPFFPLRAYREFRLFFWSHLGLSYASVVCCQGCT